MGKYVISTLKFRWLAVMSSFYRLVFVKLELLKFLDLHIRESPNICTQVPLKYLWSQLLNFT